MKRLIILVILFLFTLTASYAEQENVILPSQTGIVQKVVYEDIADEGAGQIKQLAEIKLLNGDLKGTLITVDNMLTGNPYYDINLKKGAKVILHAETDGDEIMFAVEDIKRSGTLIFLSLMFCALLVYIGRKKGLFSLVSIALTCVLIYYVLSPMILYGINPILAVILVCILSTAATMYLVGGFNRKSTSASIGCILSLIVAGLLAAITVKTAHLTGLAGENSAFLYSAHPELNFILITIAMIILASLGAVMDVGMSIASTINEIFTVDNTKSVKELFISGMNVGRDIIGTMANTLILVYLGSALPLVLLSSNIDFQKFINLNMVVTEISSALIGSIAIVICVPLTAFAASTLIKKLPEKYDFKGLSISDDVELH